MYSMKVRRLVAELPNRGEVKNPTHTARRENPVCGDVLSLSLRIQDGVVHQLRFRAQGCTAALACGASLAYICEGKTVEHCRKVTMADIVGFLDGLPPHKLHGAELALETLQAALA